jgi:hypothetical protein
MAGGSTAMRLPLTVLLKLDQSFADGQQASPGTYNSLMAQRLRTEVAFTEHAS